MIGLHFRRFKSTGTTILSVLKEMGLFVSGSGSAVQPRDYMTEVEMIYLTLGRPDEKGFNKELLKRMQAYITQKNFQLIYYLLNKIDFMHQGWQPSIHVYNEIFKSIYLMPKIPKSTKTPPWKSYPALAQFSLQLIDECSRQRLRLNLTSFQLLDKTIASSSLIQHQLIYQQVLLKHNRTSMPFLMESGQYERCIDMFNKNWEAEPTVETFKQMPYYNLILFALERQDYSQVLKFMEILRKVSLPIEPRHWGKIISECSDGGDYELTLYCYDHYIKDKIKTFTLSRLYQVSQVFAFKGNTAKVLELMDLIQATFHTSMDTELLSIIIESYCNAGGYQNAWARLAGSNIDFILDKHQFETLIPHYPFYLFKKSRDIEGLIKKVCSYLLSQQVQDVIYYTIMKRMHNVSNLTGMSYLIQALYKTGNGSQVIKNYPIVLHTISRSNSSKIFTLKFYHLLRSHGIVPSPTEYYYLLKNSLFSDGADDYALTKYFASEQLKHHGDLTPKQLQLLQGITNDDQIQSFLRIYLLDQLKQKAHTDYHHQLTHNLENVLQPEYPADLHKIGNYNYKYDRENAQMLDLLW